MPGYDTWKTTDPADYETPEDEIEEDEEDPIEDERDPRELEEDAPPPTEDTSGLQDPYL